jgi:hypothetical protein
VKHCTCFQLKEKREIHTKILVGKPEEKTPFGRYTSIWERWLNMENDNGKVYTQTEEWSFKTHCLPFFII